MSKFVYADNAATTPVLPEVADVMMNCFKQEGLFGNPSSLYSKGVDASIQLDNARKKIAELLGCKPTELFFTSCGTESDNWAIKGAAYANVKKGKHLITTKIEHHAVLYSMESLEKQGFEVTYLDVDENGFVTPEQLENAIREDTTLVAVMFANNEIGTIEPIKELAKVCHKHKVIFFTDAVQAVGNVDINIADLGVDMLSLSGHKIHTPKGVGMLYIKTGTRVYNLIDGGGQERGRRGGTENVAYALALAKALEIAVGRISETDKIKAKRDRLIKELLKIERSRLNGPIDNRLPGNVNISFECIEGESLLLLLDAMGICCSTGSACSSKSLEPSHVLLAIGLPAEKAHGSLRISITHETTDEDIDYILECVPKAVARLRAMSPLWN